MIHLNAFTSNARKRSGLVLSSKQTTRINNAVFEHQYRNNGPIAQLGGAFD